jgi:hypothetical protein
MSRPDNEETAKPKPGPKPETLIIPGDWKEAVKDALAKGKPPAPKKKSTKKKRRPK